MVTDKNSLNTQATDLRLDGIKHWIESTLDLHGYRIEVASADASFRRYFRLRLENKSYIIMDAPPEKENCESFVYVAKLIEASGVQAPHIFNFNKPEGYMLLSDLGSTAYLDELNAQTVDALYSDAIHAIVKMQGIRATLPDYDEALLQSEMGLFKDWFLQKHMGLVLTDEQASCLVSTFALLAESALQQPVVFVHRDYHSRNLMKVDQGNPGVIDFQDAVNGPASYDLVSLIKDCYIAWPREKQLQWVDLYLALSGLQTERQAFIKSLDLMGMQRHLKAIGIFSRLNYRDGKPAYLNDIPRTMTYVLDVCQRYKELSGFADMLLTFGIQPDGQTWERIQ